MPSAFWIVIAILAIVVIAGSAVITKWLLLALLVLLAIALFNVYGSRSA